MPCSTTNTRRRCNCYEENAPGEVKRAAGMAIAVMVFSCLACLGAGHAWLQSPSPPSAGIFIGQIPAVIAGIFGIIATSIPLCCGKSQPGAYLACGILCCLAFVLHLASGVLAIMWCA